MIKVGLIEQTELNEMLQMDKTFEVVFSCSGKDARQTIENNEVDVVVTEYHMEGEDGLALVSKYTNIKFIVASELKSEIFISKAYESGAKFYLVKPLTLEVAKQHIEDCLSGNQKENRVVRKRSVSEKSLDERISNIFVSVGIPAHIKGYQFLREGIKLAVDNPQIINAITKSLYPTIAEKFDTTSSKVERAIRHAIEVAWNRGKIENINSLFGVKVYNSQDKPTNGEFIALLADKMLLECSY